LPCPPAYPRPRHVLEDTTMRHRTIGFLVTLALGLLVAPLAADVQPLKGAPRYFVRSYSHGYCVLIWAQLPP
jgi:hypothetical protein